MAGRSDYAKRLLADDLYARLQNSRVLMVGAGGIGCELLKNLVTTGFKTIEIIDLDTIDLSNLNRQFLFRKEHVKRPKSIVAKETAQHFNPNVSINAIHANIKEPQFNVDYFKSFDIVLNALDNMDARRHVNKMCMAANVPLVESGTAGYSGQVQPIQKDVSECYDCSGKPVPKGFAVCTIRSTPSTPIHCIVWAKSYLFPQLFGPEEENSDEELDKAAADGENAAELGELRKEAQAIKEMRTTLGQADSPQRVFDKVYKRDIERLLTMEDMWKHRTKPIPLSYETLSSQAPSTSTSSAAHIKDQRQLSLHDSFLLFIDSLKRLTDRVNAEPGTTLDWDKDDDDALDFATAAANLRAHIFGIPSKTRFDVKRGFLSLVRLWFETMLIRAPTEMAGNIIPAIATTNAIVAGLIVLQCLVVLQKNWKQARFIWVARTADKAIGPSLINPPNPTCAVCRTPYVAIKIHPSKLVVSDFVEKVVKQKLGLTGDMSLVEGSRVLLDPDFDDNLSKTFGALGIKEGTMLVVNDEEGDLEPIVFLVSELSDDATDDFVIEHEIPPLPTKPAPPEPPKEDSDSDDEIEEVQAPTRVAVVTAAKKRSASDAKLQGAVPELKKAKVAQEETEGVIEID